jgi:uncharacterized protein (TIGR03435 family)
MTEPDDISLLRQYVETSSEQAFGTLVSRHINKVYSVALRHTRNPHQAEEITQADFVILARKARGLGKRVILSGWLYQTARLASVTYLRSEIRRTRREQEAHMQSLFDDPAVDEASRQIIPLLDAAMAGLNTTDRHAVVLRFFDGKSLREVGAALSASEEAAKKRVNRALEKLQKFFAKRGVDSTKAIIAGTITSHSVQAAPAALAKSVTAVALAKGATASISTLTLVRGALKIMAWTKAQTAVVIGVAAILTISTTTAVVHQVVSSRQEQYYESIFEHPDGSSLAKLEQCPPVLIIRPTRYPDKPMGFGTPDGRQIYDNTQLSDLIAWAYNADPFHEILPEDAPKGSYDYMNTLPNENDALRERIKKQFGLVARREVRPTDVLLLRAADPFKLKSFRTKGGPFACYGMGGADTQFRYFTNAPLSLLAAQIGEGYFQKPCIDTTEADAKYDFALQWADPADLTGESRLAALQPVIERQLERLGLELVPTNMPIEMLVVEKAN